jgi:GDSL-like Lipase/Acylhydrolase family
LPAAGCPLPPLSVLITAPRLPGRYHSIPVDHRQIHQYHPVFGYHFIPGLRARVPHSGGGYLLRVNEAGFRCEREFVPTKSARAFRVLLFGDSFTAGDGVSNVARYGDLLERKIPGVEVYNFGLPGSGTDQQYLIHRELGARIECDFIVIAVLVNNIRRNTARYYETLSASGDRLFVPKPYFTLDRPGHLSLHNVPVPRRFLTAADLRADDWSHLARGGRAVHAFRAMATRSPRPVKAALRFARDMTQSITRPQAYPEYNHAGNRAWILMKTILTTWIREASAPVLLMPIPMYQHVEETSDASAYRTRFHELGEDLEIVLHDPLEDIFEVPRDERRNLRFVNDIHPTPVFHALLAKSLARTLQPYIAR